MSMIRKCDRCGRLGDPHKVPVASWGDGWAEIACYVGYSTSNLVGYTLCPKCREVLKIPEDYREGTKDIGKRLIELLEELVQGVVEEISK